MQRNCPVCGRVLGHGEKCVHDGYTYAMCTKYIQPVLEYDELGVFSPDGTYIVLDKEYPHSISGEESGFVKWWMR